MILQLIIVSAAFIFLHLILKPPVDVQVNDPGIRESALLLQIKQDGDIARQMNINVYEEDSRLRSER